MSKPGLVEVYESVICGFMDFDWTAGFVWVRRDLSLIILVPLNTKAVTPLCDNVACAAVHIIRNGWIYKYNLITGKNQYSESVSFLRQIRYKYEIKLVEK